GAEQFQPCGEMADRFRIGRALDGSLACPLPVENARGDEPRLSVVMRQEFWLGLDSLRKAFFKRVGNLAVILLASALEQCVIGGVLDQSMFEKVSRLGRQSPLKENLGVY